MTVNKTIQKILIVLIVTALCLAPFSVCAAVSLDKTGSIGISVLDSESKAPIGQSGVRLYRVATARAVGDGVSFAYTDEFKANGMVAGDLSDAYLPLHLAAYAEANALAYTAKRADENGEVLFDNLPCGAYLVVPAMMAEGYLCPSPFIVSVPTANAEEGWNYHVQATPKTEKTEDSAEKTRLAVKKTWANTKNPPAAVSVALLQDNTIVETVELNAQNNWYHKWEELDDGHAWSVAELAVPTDYAVSYSASQLTVSITNTHTKPADDTSDDEQDELVQTGQLNWPIPILLVAGLLFFGVGWALLNFSKKEEESV